MHGNNSFFSRVVRKAQMKNKEAGFLTIEALLAIILIVGALPFVHNYYVNQQISNQTDIAASHLKELESAVARYVKANWSSISSVATATNAYTIDPADLKSQGFLRTNFQVQSPFGQDYGIGVIGSPSGQLTAVILGHGGRPGTGVLTGSDLVTATKIIPETAQKLGISGGFIPYQATPGANASLIEGVGGVWTLDVSGIGNLSSLPAGSGSLASVNHFVDGAVNNDYLHRRDIGIPELNRMQTTLDMDGNDIDNVESLTNMTGHIHTSGTELADDVNGNPVNAFVADRGSIELRDGVVKSGDVFIDDMTIGGNAVPMSRGVYDVRILSPRDIVPMPSCPAGSVPQIFVSTQSSPVGEGMVVETTSGNRSGDVLRFNAFADDLGTSWRVRQRVYLSPGGWFDMASGSGILFALIKCT